MATVLVVDDEKNIREHLATYVRSLGHRVEVAAEAAAALACLGRTAVDVVFSDVRMAGMDGLALLNEVRRRRVEAVVVLMTAYATVEQAVEAMRAGAYDYLVKPFSLEQVGLLLDRVLEVQGLRRENRVLRGAVGTPEVLQSANPAMRRALAVARQVAATDATVLLTGESGTGKNVLARAIHDWSPRAAAPFVTVACTTRARAGRGDRARPPARSPRFTAGLGGLPGRARIARRDRAASHPRGAAGLHDPGGGSRTPRDQPDHPLAEA
jgi:DNA-binding NtrC family response regulator